MNEDTRRAIVAEIVAATRIRTKQPYQFDVEDYVAAAPGVSRQRAYTVLRDLARRGELETELVNVNGRQRRVWWHAGDARATE